MKIYLNKVVCKTRYGHALDVVCKLGRVNQSQSRNLWLWYNLSQESPMSDENQDLHINKGVLVGHHDHNSGAHTHP